MRRKADGAAFEREFRDIISRSHYIRRLPTPSTGYAGLRQPADFYVVGNKFNYVELKETTSSSFSVVSMEQYDMVESFVADVEKYGLENSAEYLLIVHYLNDRLYQVVNAREIMMLAKAHKSLKANDAVGISYKTIEEIGGRDF